MMTTIEMTAAQATTYDAGGEPAERMMRELRAEARDAGGEALTISAPSGVVVVEIRSADGVTVDAIEVSR